MQQFFSNSKSITKFVLIVIVFILCSCNTNNLKPADDALGAAREFADACFKGNFEKAKFYLVDEDSNKFKLEQIEIIYNNYSSEQIKEFKNSSIVIKELKIIDSNTSQITLASSYDKKFNTLILIRKNNNWLVDFNN